MTQYFKRAFLFPGQGAQYPGMGKDFYEAYPLAKHTFQEADDVLNRKLSELIFKGPAEALTLTKNSQLAIYVSSLAIWRVLSQLFPDFSPAMCAGLSLGEYSALTASGRLSYREGLQLVDYRAQYMHEACEASRGTMAAVIGLEANEVEQIVKEVNLPHDLWAANFNCPGQVVLSGTLKGIEFGMAAVKAKGARRVVPLNVHGAFHSGLMQPAQDRLAPHIEHVPLLEGSAQIIMNATGAPAQNLAEVRQNLIRQVTHPVRWEQSMRHMIQSGADVFLEIGCGKTLTGFHQRMGTPTPCIGIETVDNIKTLDELLKGSGKS